MPCRQTVIVESVYDRPGVPGGTAPPRSRARAWLAAHSACQCLTRGATASTRRRADDARDVAKCTRHASLRHGHSADTPQDLHERRSPPLHHGLCQGTLHRRENIHLHQHRLRDVQRRAAGDGGATGVGPQHLRLVPLPVRSAVPRVGRLRVRGRRVAGRARVPGRGGRAAPRARLSARLRGWRAVPGAERGGLRRVDGRVAGGVVALRPAGRAGAPRHGPAARPQAGAAGRGALPRRGAPALRHDRGGGARGAQQRLRDHRVRSAGPGAADSGIPTGAAPRAARGRVRAVAEREGRRLRTRRRARRRRRRRQRLQRRRAHAARLAQEGQPAHVHHTRQDFLAGRDRRSAVSAGAAGKRRQRQRGPGARRPAPLPSRAAPHPRRRRAAAARRRVGRRARPAARAHAAPRAAERARRRAAHPAQRPLAPPTCMLCWQLRRPGCSVWPISTL